jgi:S1-C subfamily serine protease
MTAASPTLRAGRGRLETWSLVGVVALTVVAVLAGLVLRTTVVEGTRRVDLAGSSVDVPVGWVVATPVGDALLSAHDPSDPNLRYVVERYDPAGLAVDDAARHRLTGRTAFLAGFAILEDGAGSIGTVTTHRLRYTFTDGTTQPPVVVEALEDHFAVGDRVVEVRLEAPQATFDAAVDRYDRFRGDVASALATASTADRRASALDRRESPPAPPTSSGILAQVAMVGRGLPSGPLSDPGATTADLVAATVEVQQIAFASDPASVVAWGSGTILSSDGLILTNAHVARPSADGLAIYSEDPTPVRDPAGLVVAVIDREDQPPVPRYRAHVVVVDGYLDAALIRIDQNLDGTPIAPGSLHLPTVQLGNSDALRVGDKMTVVGFPGIGGDTISLSSGEVSGFLGDDRIGSRAWIKTDAIVSHGNSGGLAADASGAIVGIPTRAYEDVGGYSLVRPIGLIRPMIDSVAGGGSYATPYVVPETGSERVSFDTWTDTVSGCAATSRLTSYPSAAREAVALFQQTGMAVGEDVLIEWRIDSRVVVRDSLRIVSGGANGGCLQVSVYSDRGLPEGRYRVDLYLGPSLRDVASAETIVGAAGPGAANLSGFVSDVDSGAPIAGAVIYILVPGTDAQAWYGAPSDDVVAGFAVTGADGSFRIAGLESGVVYPAVIVADSYLPAAGTLGPLPPGDVDLPSDITLGWIGP